MTVLYVCLDCLICALTVKYMPGDFELVCLKYHEMLREFHFWRWNAQNANQQYSPVSLIFLRKLP